MRRVVRDDEQRVLPRPDEDDGRHHRQGVRPEGQRGGRGQRDHEHVGKHRHRGAPVRALREPRKDLFRKRLPEIVLEFLAFHATQPPEEL